MNKKFLFPLVASLLVLSACGGNGTSSKQESSQPKSEPTSQPTSVPTSEPSSDPTSVPTSEETSESSEVTSESSEPVVTKVDAVVRSGENIRSENTLEETEEGSGVFVGNIVMTQWNSVEFTFGSTVLAFGSVNLEGLFCETTGADWTDKLYVDNVGDTRFFRGVTGEVTYKITYTAETNTLKAELVIMNKLSDAGAPDGGVMLDPQADGTFTETRVLKQWNRFQLKYYDAEGNSVDVNPDNTDVSGDAYATYGASTTYHVYYDEGIFCTELTNNGRYTFVYTPANGTTKATLVFTADSGSDPSVALSLAVASTSADTTTTVWAAGTIVHNPDAVWAVKTGNGWRTYLAVDSEGRIAYYCFNPANGYGGPDGTSYNRHSAYADYTTNPAIEILPGFGPWEPGGSAHNQWNLKAPEGGFMVTGYGDDIAQVIGVVTGGEASATTAEGEINKYYAAIDDVRVAYDAEGGKLNFSVVNK
ncbi:MAG: PT domain-containing protein [Bacilli bacterium]|nr:PT domain-containing protein [Bacilli bacterium]